MTTSRPFSFNGYEDLIRKPLELSDPRSFEIIKKLLETAPTSAGTGPFSFLIQALSSVVISPREGLHHWKKIIEHKHRLELQLRRTLNIKTACIDYYDQLGVDPSATAEPVPAAASTQGTRPAPQPLPALNGLYLNRLKEEMMRGRRYKHALSLILLAADLRKTSPETADATLAMVVKLINKAVRTVDILARPSDDHFLLMLPNTNKREALELAERLNNSIRQRLSGEGIPLTIAVGQCSKEDTAADIVKRLERLADAGKQKNPAAIYTIE
jgi:diguanylate cyclase (GGDEF)-like protein